MKLDLENNKIENTIYLCCPKCKSKEKTFEDFHKDKHRKNGLSYWCKMCCSKYQKEQYYRSKNNIVKTMQTIKNFVKKEFNGQPSFYFLHKESKEIKPSSIWTYRNKTLVTYKSKV